MSSKDLRPLILRLGHSALVQRFWILGLVSALALGFWISQNWLIPLRLSHSGQSEMRLLLNPLWHQPILGDTVVDVSYRPLRLMHLDRISKNQDLALNALKLEEALLYLPLFLDQAQMHLQLNWQMAQSSQTIALSVQGLWTKNPTTLDSLQKWNRSLDSIADLGQTPQIKIAFVQGTQVLDKYHSNLQWDQYQLLDPSKRILLVPRDSILGVFWK